jgi:hypothetical protein
MFSLKVNTLLFYKFLINKYLCFPKENTFEILRSIYNAKITILMFTPISSTDD